MPIKGGQRAGKTSSEDVGTGLPRVPDSGDVVALDSMIELARDARFESLRARAKDSPLTRADFDLLPHPEGCPADRLWELMGLLRMHTAVQAPYRDADGRRGWYSITNSVMADCDAIDRLCSRGSRAGSALASHDPLTLFLEQVVSEVMALLESDGIRVGYEETRGIVTGQRRPTTPAQRIVANIVGILYETPELARNEIVEGTFTELHRRLLRKVEDPIGVGTDSRGARGWAAQVEPEGHWKGTNLSYQGAKDMALRMTRREGVDPAEHALMVCLGIEGIVIPSRLFVNLNNTVSWLLSRLVLYQAELDVLAFIPVHDLVARWRRGQATPAPSGLSYTDSIVVIADTVDFTGNIAGTVELVRDESVVLDRLVGESLEREHLIDDAIGDDPEINHRQRAVILRAIRDPGSSFRIASHQRAYRVAYATARDDLLGLERRGYLRRTKQGSAFVFVPREDIGRLVGGRPSRPS